MSLSQIYELIVRLIINPSIIHVVVVSLRQYFIFVFLAKESAPLHFCLLILIRDDSMHDGDVVAQLVDNYVADFDGFVVVGEEEDVSSVIAGLHGSTGVEREKSYLRTTTMGLSQFETMMQVFQIIRAEATIMPKVAI